MTDTQDLLLRAQQITKRFGGLTAVNEVSVDLKLGEIHAVIGPNGAGKSTLTNLLTGDLPASSGHVRLMGQDITGWTPEKISRNGLGRSYQKPTSFEALPSGTMCDCPPNPEVSLCPLIHWHGSKMQMPCGMSTNGPNAPLNWPDYKTGVMPLQVRPAMANNANSKLP